MTPTEGAPAPSSSIHSPAVSSITAGLAQEQPYSEYDDISQRIELLNSHYDNVATRMSKLERYTLGRAETHIQLRDAQSEQECRMDEANNKIVEYRSYADDIHTQVLQQTQRLDLQQDATDKRLDSVIVKLGMLTNVVS